MFKLCVVGHGNYPDGMVSALTLLAGADNDVTKFNLNEELTHADYEEQLMHFLDENENVIIFADMTGGAPHQIASRLILEKAKGNQYIVSSAPLNLMLDILMKNQLGTMSIENGAVELHDSVEMSKSLILMLPEVGASEESDNVGSEGI